MHVEEEHSQHTQHTQRILVVEDDPTLAALEVGVLTAHGYTVVSVHTGELAVAALHTFVPDLVVLDLELSDQLNGWDVLQQLRSRTTIPVLFTTSSETIVRQHIRSRRETRLTLDHLPKPFPMQTLLKRVQRMLMIASP
jgi:DNA-binding response OmpR family regulator